MCLLITSTFSSWNIRTFFSLAAICLFLFTWLLAMLANFRATVLGRLIGIECLSDPCTGGTISMAVMHSSPVCFVTIFILDHLEVEFPVASLGFAVEVPSGFAASCVGNPRGKVAQRQRCTTSCTPSSTFQTVWWVQQCVFFIVLACTDVGRLLASKEWHISLWLSFRNVNIWIPGLLYRYSICFGSFSVRLKWLWCTLIPARFYKDDE